MLTTFFKTSLLFLIFGFGTCFSIVGHVQQASADESPDPRVEALRPTIMKLNTIVLVEIEKGLAALQKKDISSAVDSFMTAANIAPYEPMSYILLIRTFLAADQENLAYKWLMLSGRNLSDSNQIITNLYQSLKDFHLPLPKEENESPVHIALFKDNKRCAISFTFDDGERSISTDILPLFEQYGFHATVAINPGVTAEDAGNIYRGDWDDWRKAKKNGHEIANHGMNHKALPGLSQTELQTEVMDSFQIIKEKIGESPTSFVFPEDKSTPEIVNFVESKHLVTRDHDSLSAIYKNVCIPIYGGTRFSTPTARKLVDIAIDRRLWLIPQCHGLYSPIIKKSFKAISKELLVDQLEHLKENSKLIWVERFIDVYKYLKERKETQINIVATTENSLEFSLTDSLDTKVYNIPLTVNIDPRTRYSPKKVSVYNTTSRQHVPHQIFNGKISINIEPNNDIIRVQWR